MTVPIGDITLAGESFFIRVEICEKGSVGKSYTSAACLLRGWTLGFASTRPWCS